MSISLKRIHLQSGATLDVSEGVTVLVGPNNAGKSALLREVQGALHRHAGHPPVDGRVVSAIELGFEGDFNSFFEDLGRRYERRLPGNYPYGVVNETHIHVQGNAIGQQQLQQHWGLTDRLGPIALTHLMYLDAENRLGMVNGVPSYNALLEQPVMPLQRLYADREIESRISELVERAFGMKVTVNRYAGSQITLHMGRPETAESVPPPSREYLEELSSLQQAQEQGDGIRAFLGIMLSVVTQGYPLVIIDEPEAFLHPPQARILGRVLAEMRGAATQVLVATHSDDIIQGITAGASDRKPVTVARLTRSGTVNHVSQVDSSSVRSLYDDPLLRFSQILTGLFYPGVILCEAESDCTYYGAVLDHANKTEESVVLGGMDLLFTHCGGKDRLPRAVNALRSANVPCVCAVDVDILQDKPKFDELVETFGGTPISYSPRFNTIKSAVDQAGSSTNRAFVKHEIEGILDSSTSDSLTPEEEKSIRALVRSRSGWQDMKSKGRHALPSGQATEAFDSLCSDLADIGIFIVPVGELERFHPELPSRNKAEWLREVLAASKYKDSVEALHYVRSMHDRILASQ